MSFLNFLLQSAAPLHSVLQTGTHRAACAALNHLLALEPELAALLAPHAQRSVLVDWAAVAVLPAGHCRLGITAAQRFEPLLDPAEAPADVSIHIEAGIVSAAADERLRFVRIEGDALLAQTLGMLAQRLRWDAAHDLARVIGDAPAHWLVTQASSWGALLWAAAQRMKTDLDAFRTQLKPSPAPL